MDNSHGNNWFAGFAVLINILAGLSQNDISFILGAVVAILAVIDKVLSIKAKIKNKNPNS